MRCEIYSVGMKKKVRGTTPSPKVKPKYLIMDKRYLDAAKIVIISFPQINPR